MAIEYKLMLSYENQGVIKLDTDTGYQIGFWPQHIELWQEYEAWKALGNTPDPQYTSEEIAINDYNARQENRIQLLKNALIEQFEMILAMFQVGRTNGVWLATDFPQEIRDKATEWIALIDDYKNDSPE